MLKPRGRALLIVLDGFGIGKDYPFNAIQNAKMPFYQKLLRQYPHSQLLTHGEAVGLPPGVMGNSEVGHMTMGAGRVVYQDISRINRAILKGEFEKNSILMEAIQTASQGNRRLHFMGLLSDGGVHSHTNHLFALMDLCLKLNIRRVSFHHFLDGRDTPPRSSARYLKEFYSHPAWQAAQANSYKLDWRVGSVSGRYFAMDRDKRWDRVEQAYRAMTANTSLASIPSAVEQVLELVEKHNTSGKGDEFITPFCLDPQGSINSDDVIFFYNFRADRARQISQAFTDPGFSEFARRAVLPSMYVGMTRYDDFLKEVKVAFPPQNLRQNFGEVLERANLKQLRIAETEKYAHVTFFFNCGREAPFAGEDRVMIPSPQDVATYDLKPEMSAIPVTDAMVEKLNARSHDFLLMNYANADMIGHTGNYNAAVRAMETLDSCLEKVVGAAMSNHTHVLLTADHGNAEEMLDCNGEIHTQHTLNPVPFVLLSPDHVGGPRNLFPKLKDGGLDMLMPTLCEILGLEKPEEATSPSLLAH